MYQKKRTEKVEFMELWNEYIEHPGAAALPEIDRPMETVVSDASQPADVIDQPIGNSGHSGTLGEAIADDSDEEFEDACADIALPPKTN